MEEPMGRNHGEGGSGRHLGGVWEASGNRLGGIWQTGVARAGLRRKTVNLYRFLLMKVARPSKSPQRGEPRCHQVRIMATKVACGPSGARPGPASLVPKTSRQNPYS